MLLYGSLRSSTFFYGLYEEHVIVGPFWLSAAFILLSSELPRFNSSSIIWQRYDSLKRGRAANDKGRILIIGRNCLFCVCVYVHVHVHVHVCVYAAQIPLVAHVDDSTSFLDELVPNIIRTNDPTASHPTAPIFCSHLRPRAQVQIFMMAVKWAAVVNLLMTSPFLCHQWVWVRATGTDCWRQDEGWGEAGLVFLGGGAIPGELGLETYLVWRVACGAKWHGIFHRREILCKWEGRRKGNFTNGKQMCHTSQLLSLSISALLALFSF